MALGDAAKLAYIQSETSLVKGPYLVLGAVILLVAILFFFTKLPDIRDEEEVVGKNLFSSLKHKNVRWGVVAQFFYVGAQIYVFSFLLVFAEDALDMPGQQAKYYGALAGLLFMIGRFVGTFFMRFVEAYKLLMLYSIFAALLTLIVIFGSGMATLYALVGTTFFMSIMFPTIFAIGIRDTESDTKSASSFIIMSIVGGAIIPPLSSSITDMTHNIHSSYVIVLLCFLVVMFFAWNTRPVESLENHSL